MPTNGFRSNERRTNMKEYRVVVEYKREEAVREYIVSEELWLNHLYGALENDNRVEHYTVETLERR